MACRAKFCAMQRKPLFPCTLRALPPTMAWLSVLTRVIGSAIAKRECAELQSRRLCALAPKRLRAVPTRRVGNLCAAADAAASEARTEQDQSAALARSQGQQSFCLSFRAESRCVRSGSRFIPTAVRMAIRCIRLCLPLPGLRRSNMTPMYVAPACKGTLCVSASPSPVVAVCVCIKSAVTACPRIRRGGGGG